MIEKRVLAASFLSAIFLAFYAQILVRNYPMRPTPASKPAPTMPSDGASSSNGRAEEGRITAAIQSIDNNEDVIFIESDQIQLELGTRSGAIRRIVLKKFLDASGKHALQFGWAHPIFSVQAPSGTIAWNVEARTDKSSRFSGKDAENQTYQLSYSLVGETPVVQIEVSVTGGPHKGQIFRTTHSWVRSDNLGSRYNPLEVFLQTELASGKGHKRYAGPWRESRDLTGEVPRGTELLALAERYFCQVIRPQSNQIGGITLVKSTMDPAEEVRLALGQASEKTPSGHQQCSMAIYFGPRDYFYLKKAGFVDAFPIGAIGQIGLMLLLILSTIAGATHSYGVAIIVFSILITFLTAPFTLLSFNSMKKMQQLRPEQERILAQYKDDPKRANQEVLALYRKYRVSPLSGCLPMLLQMPIFFAMFRAISHFIELRGKSFLWISDLSLPDRVMRLPISLPIFGRELNVLPIIMAGAMYFQTKMSQGETASSSTTQSANIITGPLMPILFGVMCYNFPSGLVLYWLTNTLMALVLFRFSGYSKTPAQA